MNTTQNQKKLLLECMKLHPEVARGRLRRKGESKNTMKQLLEEMANAINIANEGPVKSSSEWLKTWKDWKSYVLKKEAKRRNYYKGTGGGSPIKISFSSLEEKLLEFLTPEAAGLEDIPQGGINLQENVTYESQEEHPDNLIQEPHLDSNIIQNFECDENENMPPHKKLCENDLNKSMSVKMVNIQEDKLALKKEEINIQRQLLGVLQSTLTEIQKIRTVVDTFGYLQQ